LSSIFRQYNHLDEVVMIPDLPPPPPVLEEEEGAEILPARARAMAEKILEEAQKQAQSLRQEAAALAESESKAILQEASQQAEQLRLQAQREGAEQGEQEKKQEIMEVLQQLDAALSQLREEHRIFLSESEKSLKLLAVDIAQKLIEKKLPEDDALLLGLVKKAVQSIREADWISVEISASLPQLVERLEKELGDEINGMRLDIVPRDLPEGGCWVQTSDGAIDASVATQAANLKAIFSHMDEA
jgi:flagellar assembly protein FliH